jgi:hypothetical protein
LAIAAISSRVVGVAVEEKIESASPRFGKDELRMLRLALRHGIGSLPVGGVQKIHRLILTVRQRGIAIIA